MTFEKEPHEFWVEQIAEIIERYEDLNALEQFIACRKTFLSMVEGQDFTSFEPLSHIRKILYYVERAIRDRLHDKAYQPPQEGMPLKWVPVLDKVGQPVVDEKGKVQTEEIFQFTLEPEPWLQPTIESRIEKHKKQKEKKDK